MEPKILAMIATVVETCAGAAQSRRGRPPAETMRVLASLREQGILLIGSGSITHNLGELNWRAGPETNVSLNC